MVILSDFFQLMALDMSGKEISFENIAEELTKEGIVKEVATAERVAELYSEGIIAIRDNAVVVLLHRF